MKYFSTLCLFLFSITMLSAQSSKEYAVMISAKVQNTPAKIILSWQADTSIKFFQIYRKRPDMKSWQSRITMNATATGFTDNDVRLGEKYEYMIQKISKQDTFRGVGYIYAGAEIPAIENRGKIILLIDDAFKTVLASEINRLELDLAGDGWQVIRRYANRAGKVYDVKEIIVDAYKTDPANVKAAFLIGHIPVPYSGNYAVDGHFPDHYGAWPADAYYADMQNTGWTDEFVENDTASRPENENFYEDGKFDQTILPSDLELQLGRVDFHDLPAFNVSETELMRRYLDKDHAWRTKAFTAKEQGVVEDNFQGLGAEAFGASGYYNFAPMFGADKVFTEDYLQSVSKDTFMWSYGSGPGGYSFAGNIATTNDFASKKINTVFTMLFGSYFGDWDTQNNLLRASLAAEGMTLTSVWSGRPHWNFHHMALGENIGYSALLTQNDYKNYFRVIPDILPDPNYRLVTAALLGDPTLRMHVIAPVKNLNAVKTQQSVKLNWQKSKDDVLAYKVYRTTDLAKPFTLLDSLTLSDSVFTDFSPNSNTKNYYMVRALKLQASASGTYYNLSQGIIDSVDFSSAINDKKTSLPLQVNVYPNPSESGLFMVSGFNNSVDISCHVTDAAGRTIFTKKSHTNFIVDLRVAAKGVYFMHIHDGRFIYTKKLIYR